MGVALGGAAPVGLGAAMGVGGAGATLLSHAASSSASATPAQPRVLRIAVAARIGRILSGRQAIRT